MNEMKELQFRTASEADIAALVPVINAAYRGVQSREGWTTEADLVAGDRVTAAEVTALIARSDTVILLCLLDELIVGTVELRRRGVETFLGMFVVNPRLQARGIGKKILGAAEEFVRSQWSSTSIALSVISVRDELIEFYERRGYKRTGVFEDFPEQLGQSSPIVAGLQFEQLSKSFE
jgi:ribosomal protein S18 acetylase RimI-like enzyme